MADFWCERCRRWTAPDPVQEGDSTLNCSNCGEYYTCGECGFEINPAGECERPPEFGVCPSSVTPPSGPRSEDPDGYFCYSDHETDIAYYGLCTMCGSDDKNIVKHVLPGVERLTGVDPVAASQVVVAEQSLKFVDGVLLDLQTAHVITTVYAALSKANQAKLRALPLTRAGEICFKLTQPKEATP